MSAVDLFCGARVDGGLCLHVESRHETARALVNGVEVRLENSTLCIECAIQIMTPISEAGHAFIPAYVRCPECDGSTYLIEPDGVETGYYDCQCAAFDPPGFIPVSEEVRT